jgi:PAS domain S-box-containing protein
MAKAQILVVEDNNIVVMELRDRLQSLGYAVCAVASSGEEAIEKVGEARPELVLMDIRLRGTMDGVEAAEQIRNRFDIPVIYLTSYVDEDTLQRAKVTEPYGYILKPFEEKELYSTIEMAVYKHKIERKLKESERWLATTLRSIGDGVIATDEKGLVTFMNPVAEALTGWKQEDALGRDLKRVFHIVSEETGKVTDNPVAKVTQGGVVVGWANHILIAKEGREIPIDDSAAPIRDDKGNVAGVVLAFRDITERKQVDEALERHAAQLALINDIGRKIVAALDLDQVLQSIVDSATRLIPAGTGSVIHLIDEAAGKLSPRATSAPEVNVQEKLELPIREGIAGLVMQEKRPINVPNVEEDPRFLSTDTPTPKKSLLTVPLLIDGGCIGTLSLNSEQVGAFSSDDERLLTTLAAQAAVAVRNARLHQEVQHRVEELTFLNRVGRAVTSSLDLQQVLTTIMEETALIVRTEACSIFLLDEESDELAFEVVVGPRSEKMKGLRLPLEQGIAGWVAREGQWLLVPDVGEEPRFYSGIDEATGFVTRSVLAVPLKVKGKVIGVIEAVNKIESHFGQADVALLSSMAQSAAIAIENAQLFGETRRRFEEMSTLHDISLDITARLEMPELLKSIVERATRLLRADAGGVYLYDQEREELRLAIGYNYTEKHVGVPLKPGEGMAGKVFQKGEPLIVDDYRTWEGRAAVFEADQPFTAVLQVPLKWQERIIGVLAINADVQKRPFNQDDVWLATLFANQAAIAIENAWLYEELQHQMEELKRTQTQLFHTEKMSALGRLAASLAHEINNPLQSVTGCLDLAQEGLAEGENVNEYLRIAHEEVRRVAHTVAQMRDLSRPASEEKGPTEVNALLEQVLELSRKQCNENQVETVWRPAADLPTLLLAADQIKQVFLNLLLNAIDAMPGGGQLQVSTAYTSQPAGVRIEFTDSGAGIAPDVLPQIFEPFYSTKPEGTGLGLSISYSIVERHGGYIEVGSWVGEGSTFTVWLPA